LKAAAQLNVLQNGSAFFEANFFRIVPKNAFSNKRHQNANKNKQRIFQIFNAKSTIANKDLKKQTQFLSSMWVVGQTGKQLRINFFG